jgi:hypothetical protein
MRGRKKRSLLLVRTTSAWTALVVVRTLSDICLRRANYAVDIQGSHMAFLGAVSSFPAVAASRS